MFRVCQTLSARLMPHLQMPKGWFSRPMGFVSRQLKRRLFISWFLHRFLVQDVEWFKDCGVVMDCAILCWKIFSTGDNKWAWSDLISKVPLFNPSLQGVPWLPRYNWRLGRLWIFRFKLNLLAFAQANERTLNSKGYFCGVSLLKKDIPNIPDIRGWNVGLPCHIDSSIHITLSGCWGFRFLMALSW